MQTNNSIIEQTKAWIEQVVIGLQLCPFAAQPFSNKQIEYIVCHEKDTENQLHSLMAALSQLDNNQEIETSLIIFPEPTLSFENYLDLLELAHVLMEEYGYTSTYQLASFHPEYQFENTDSDDASNYTNRSPFPMLHCLRESSIEKVLQTFPQPEKIPQNNIQRTQALGTEKMQHILEGIREITEKNHQEDSQYV